MSDPLRTDSSRAGESAPDADRDAKIEQLLLLGLDHYFSAAYEQAINVWTRALFLDRSHPKARAYIERARSALAERQRESEEMLHHGLAALEQGDPREARRLLQTAVTGSGTSDEALALLDRLDRFELGAGMVEGGASAAGVRPLSARTPVDPPRPIRTSVVVLLLGFAATIAAVTVIATQVDWRALVMPPPAPAPPSAASAASSLPLPRRGEIALTRARGFSDRGHLREALATLEAVQPTDPEKNEADQLRARIQRELIALALPDSKTRPNGSPEPRP
jgi:tetratricopeptide (TPR) repeat protein